MPAYPSTHPPADEVVGLWTYFNTYLDGLETDTVEERLSQWRYGVTTLISGTLLGAAAFVALLGRKVVPQFDTVYLVLVLAAAVTGAVGIVRVSREQPHILGALRRPRQAMMQALIERVTSEAAAVEHLLTFDTATLQFGQARLTQMTEIRRERMETLLGAISKLGLLPSVFAAAIALLATLKGAPAWIQVAAPLLTAVLIWLYNVAANIQSSLTDARLLLGLLERTVAVKEDRT